MKIVENWDELWIVWYTLPSFLVFNFFSFARPKHNHVKLL